MTEHEHDDDDNGNETNCVCMCEQLKVMSLNNKSITNKMPDNVSSADSKASACNTADLGSIPELGRFPEEGNGNPLQYSCLENPMDRGALWDIVHGVTKSRTRLSN